MTRCNADAKPSRRALRNSESAQHRKGQYWAQFDDIWTHILVLIRPINLASILIRNG